MGNTTLTIKKILIFFLLIPFVISFVLTIASTLLSEYYYILPDAFSDIADYIYSGESYISDLIFYFNIGIFLVALIYCKNGILATALVSFIVFNIFQPFINFYTTLILVSIFKINYIYIESDFQQAFIGTVSNAVSILIIIIPALIFRFVIRNKKEPYISFIPKKPVSIISCIFFVSYIIILLWNSIEQEVFTSDIVYYVSNIVIYIVGYFLSIFGALLIALNEKRTK